MSDVGSLPDSPNSSSVPLAASSTENDERYLQQQRKENGRLNTLLRVPSADEYIIPGGVSMLDISTRLRIKEAELNIVRRDFSDLLAERNALETQCRRHEESWKFALQQLGRAIEQRNEAIGQLQIMEGGGSPVLRGPKSPEMKIKKMKSQQLRTELESYVQQLNTQTRVSRQLEYERDRANDDYEFSKAQLQTVMLQHQDLLNACAEVARQRDRALSEAQLLREELHRYDSELHNSIELEIATEGEQNGATSNAREKALLQQIKLLKEEREHSHLTYQQSLEQYKRQLNKVNLEKRNVTASADAMRALLQRKLESAQGENSELRAELRAAGELITQLKDQLAQLRISQQQGGGLYNGESSSTSHDDTPPESQSSQVYPMVRPGSSGLRSIPTLSQDTGISVYSNESSFTTSLTSSHNTAELISPGNSLSGYRVSSARTRRNHYVPTASPFPEESQEHSSGEDNASWI